MALLRAGKIEEGSSHLKKAGKEERIKELGSLFNLMY